MANTREGQLARHGHIRRAEGEAQQLPGGDEAHVLVLGGHGMRVGVRVNKVEADALSLPDAADAAHGHGQGQLLPQFADEAFLRGFARLQLAAGEFPQVGVMPTLPALTDQNPAISAGDDAGGYFDHGASSCCLIG